MGWATAVLSERLSKERKGLFVKKFEGVGSGKGIMLFHWSMFFLATLAVPISAYGAYGGGKAIYEKMKNVNVPHEEIERTDRNVKEDGFTENRIGDLNELRENENGQTYGPDILGADLIEVEMGNGQVGYVYRESLYHFPESLEDARTGKGKIILDVFENDGKTKIGQFTLENGRF